MDATFHEEVTPVVHRTHAGIQVFIGLNVMKFVDRKENVKWETIPGITPPGQTLVDDLEFEVDTEVRDGD